MKQLIPFGVIGTPAPQGSKKGYVVNGRVNMVESSAAVKPWREAVAAAFRDHMFRLGEPRINPNDPVYVAVDFRFEKPRTSKLTHPGRRQGDLDKLLRATYDGLVMSGYLPDDSQIQSGRQSKRWTLPGEAPGATITIS